MENMGELADQQMGVSSTDENVSESSGVPTVDNVEPVESVDSVGSGVDPPELLPAHEIASEIAASRPESTEGDVDEVDEEVDNCESDVSDVVRVPVSGSMIDATDFRGVLSEPTYQTLNGRMTPPGFSTSSSYATLTPLQPLPPISTMSDKFTHHYGHHGNGGFTLMHMQNAATLQMNTNQYQYDKLGTAMAAAGMNMSPTLGVNQGHHHHHHHHHVTAATMINSNGGIHSHSSGIPSPPYPSNGLHSPDKSLSPTNGYDYTLRQGSPQSPSSVNLHSPTSLMPSLNGLPTSPPSSHIPSPPPQVTVSSMSSIPITVSGVLTSVTAPQQLSHVTHHVKMATTLTAAPQPITVLQAVTPTPAAIAPTAQTVTIVQTASAGVSNLATTIVSTPVAVVTTANVLHHQQQQQLNNIKQQQQQQQILSIGGNNGSKQQNSITQTSSSASNNGADDIEEINTKDLAQRISAELKRYSIPQAIFAQRVLCRSQGTLSDLLRNPKPWSKLKSGRETFRRMQKWLEEPEFQRMSALRLAEKEMRASAANGTELRSKLQMSEPHKQFNSFDGVKQAAAVREKRRGQQYFHYQYEPYRSNYYASGAASEQPFIGEYSSSEWISAPQTSLDNNIACKRKEEQQSVAKSPTAPKKPRLVFTDLQRRTLQAIFKETKRPSKEMQITISQQLGLELSTVGNFFMNARRRSQDKWLDDNVDAGSMSPASTSSSSQKAMSTVSKGNVNAQHTSVLTLGANAAIVTCT